MKTPHRTALALALALLSTTVVARSAAAQGRSPADTRLVDRERRGKRPALGVQRARAERPRPLPNSITEAVLNKHGGTSPAHTALSTAPTSHGAPSAPHAAH